MLVKVYYFSANLGIAKLIIVIIYVEAFLSGLVNILSIFPSYCGTKVHTISKLVETFDSFTRIHSTNYYADCTHNSLLLYLYT